MPVEYQEYATEAEEYADLLADNRIAELAEMDNDKLSEILKDLQETENFDMDLTGFDEDAFLSLVTIVFYAATVPNWKMSIVYWGGSRLIYILRIRRIMWRMLAKQKTH